MAITAVQSLMYRPETTGQGSRTEITRHGTVVYDGTARRFHFWHFRTRPLLEDIPVIQDNTSTEEILNIVAYRRTVMGHILEGLRGDARQVADDIGLANLHGDHGGDILVSEIVRFLFPHADRELRSLYREGLQTIRGPMVRQYSENIFSYISRRRYWYVLLKLLDATSAINIPEERRGCMLLDAASTLQPCHPARFHTPISSTPRRYG